MTSHDQYVPTDEEVRTDYITAYTDQQSSQLLAGMAFDRWLAKRDELIRRQQRYIEELEAGRVTPRAHLAAQEPSDAELDAAHAAFTAHSRTRLSEDREFDETVCIECGYATNWPDGYRTWKRGSRHAAREAILAARAARRDEENLGDAQAHHFPAPLDYLNDTRRDKEKR